MRTRRKGPNRIRSVSGLVFLLVLLLVSGLTEATDGDMPVMPDTEITIPWDEFTELIRELLGEPIPPPPAPPIGVSVLKAVYDMKLSAGLLFVRAEISVETKGIGWHEVFITGDGASLTSITIDGKEATTLVRDGSVYVIIEGCGRFNIGARFYVPAPDTPGLHTASFKVPDAASGEARLNYDRNLEGVGINGVVTASVGGSLTAVVERGGIVKISYTVATPREEVAEVPKEVGEPEILSEVMTVVDVEEEALYVESIVNFEVRNAPTTSFLIAIPKGFDLVDVKGEGISGWRPVGEKFEIEVKCGYEVKGDYSITLFLERDFSEEEKKIEFPKITPMGTKRTTGYITLVSGGGLEIREGKADMLRPQDPSELPLPLLSLFDLPPIISYRFTRPDWNLVADVKRGKFLPVVEAFADSANSVALVVGDGKMVVRTDYFIRNKSRQYLKITVPDGGEFWSAFHDGKSIKVQVGEDGKVLIPLPLGVKGNMEPFVVETVMLVPVSGVGLFGTLILPLPSIDVPVAQMMATFYLPEKKAYLRFGGDMDEIEYFEKILAPDTSTSFIEDNIKLRKDVYMRQNELERVIDEEQTLDLIEPGEVVAPRFDVPLRGKVKRFVKLIVIEEESSVSATYIDSRIFALFILILVLGISAASFLAIKKLVSVVKKSGLLTR